MPGGMSTSGQILPLNANVRKTIRGGHGSVYLKGGSGRSSTMAMNQSMTLGDLDYVNNLLDEQ